MIDYRESVFGNLFPEKSENVAWMGVKNWVGGNMTPIRARHPVIL